MNGFDAAGRQPGPSPYQQGSPVESSPLTCLQSMAAILSLLSNLIESFKTLMILRYIQLYPQ